MDTSSLPSNSTAASRRWPARRCRAWDKKSSVVVPEPGTNTIGWLVWHLARVQDHHVSELLGTEQAWVNGDWARRFGLDPDPTNTGYGHSPAEVAAVRPRVPRRAGRLPAGSAGSHHGDARGLAPTIWTAWWIGAGTHP